MNLPKNLKLLTVWFLASNIVAFTIVAYFVLHPYATQKESIEYSVFASKPLVETQITDSIELSDARAVIIDQYFAKHKCPLTGTGKTIVELSDKYNFAFWWLPAIAWQESTCGKQIIEGSYNPLGYGIYGSKVTKFLSWDEAFTQVAKDLSKNYFSKGLIEPCDVQKVYTPSSKGSWCKSIKFFRDELLDYKTT